MAGLGQFSVSLSDEAKELIQCGIDAVKALTEQLTIHNSPLEVEVKEAPVGKRVEITPLFDMPPIFTTPPGRRIAAFDEGTTVRVPDGMVAVMVPQHLMRTAVDAVLKGSPTP